MPETKDLLLRHPEFDHWQDMYRNVWSRPETARYMLWDLTTSESDAKTRMERSIRWQIQHPTCWFVYEKATGQAIGFAGMAELSPGVWEDTGIALGPEFTGRGYGTQLLNALTDYAREHLQGRKFICTCRAENSPSRSMILACGFRYTHRENRTDPRTSQPYILDFYEKQL